MSQNALVVLILTIAVAIFASCIATPPTLPSDLQMDEEITPTGIQNAEIRSGPYHRVDIPGAQPDPIALGIIRAVIDRQNNAVSFELKDGLVVTAPLRKADSPIWEQGCPTSVNVTQMEILHFAVDSFVLDGVTFEEPVLVATCPAPSLAFVLREAGSGPGDSLPAVACDWWKGAKCIYFAQNYITLHGKIVDFKTEETIPDAELTFSSPAGHQSFNATYQLSLPGDALVDFAIHASGYQDANGQIEISGDLVIFQFETGVYAEEEG